MNNYSFGIYHLKSFAGQLSPPARNNGEMIARVVRIESSIRSRLAAIIVDIVQA